MGESRLKLFTSELQVESRAGLTISLLILLTAVILRIAIIGRISTIDADEGYSLVSARFIQQGMEPYNDFFLAQTPLWFYLIVAAWEALDIQSPMVAWALARSICVLAAALTVILVHLTSRRVGGEQHGILTAVLLSASMTFYFYGFATTPEITSGLLAIIGIFLSIREQTKTSTLLSGLFLGLGGMTKASALYLFPILLLHTAVRERRLKPLLLLILSTLLPLTPLLAYDLKKVFQDLVVYRGTSSTYWAEYTTAATYAFTRLELPITIIGLAGVVCLLVTRDLTRRVLALYPVASILGTLATPTPFAVHYFNFFAPFLAVSGGTVFALTWKRKTLLTAATSVLLITVFASTRIGISYYAYATDARAHANLLTAAELVRGLTSPDEYVVGNHFVIFLADRRMPPPFVDTSSFMAHSGLLTNATLIEACQQYQVRLVLLYPDFDKNYSDFVRYVKQNYSLAHTIDDLSIYIKAA